jgi:hypothetical protein
LNPTKILLGISLLASMCAAHAFQISRFSPQGQVSPINQVVAKFDQAVVTFGDPKAPAPMRIECNTPEAAKGTGRWLSANEWVFDFDQELKAGTFCTALVNSGIKSASGADYTGTSSYKFNSGGPFVQQIWPYPDTPVDEEQAFVLQLNGPATLASVQANLWCAVDGLGERVAVKLIDGKDRQALLKSQGLDAQAAKNPLAVVTVACNRRLTPAAKVQLVYGQGVATPATPGATEGGIANTVEKRFSFQVREPFAASFSCERQNAQSACLPIRPISVNFNAPITFKQAQGIRLTSGKDSFKPVFGPDEASAEADHLVNRVSFQTVLPEQSKFVIELPKGFQDAAGRTLRNADSFPMAVATGAMPPLAKFAAAPFGIVERLAEPNGLAVLPVTLRRVEGTAASNTQGGKVSTLTPVSDADIITWLARVQRYDNFTVSRKMAAKEVKGPLPKALDPQSKDEVQARMVSLLQGQPGIKTFDLPHPTGGDPRPFEVVGIPLTTGFHVVEIASEKLGSALLDERHGGQRLMFVRTSALVTNLGVHFKLGRENAMAWVTTLDKGQPVVNARVRVSSCDGRELATGTTNAQGLATFTNLSPRAPGCNGKGQTGSTEQAYFVSARATQPTSGTQGAVDDMAFTWSDWNRGIEPWRFNLPTSSDARPDERAHSILDRTLLRAGETVSMKHLLRAENSKGFTPAASAPAEAVAAFCPSFKFASA